MSLLNQDITRDFQEESRQILADLSSMLELFEDDAAAFSDGKLYAEFAQKIDRIMGGATTLAMVDTGNTPLQIIGRLCMNCKELGYAAAQNPKEVIRAPLLGFWSDTLELLEELLAQVPLEPKDQKATEFPQVLEKRLEWLRDKLKKSS